MSIKEIVGKASLFGGLGIVGAALVLSACGSTSNGNAGTQAAAPPAPVALHFKIVGADDGKLGPDGAKHDLFQALDDQPLVVGQQVTISIDNTDDGQHTMTAPELGLNILVPGKKDGQDGVATYTFTPTKAGNFRWFCAIPCDSDNNYWDMQASVDGPDQSGFMAGAFTVNAS